ncbi:MAG TPA: RNA polymerase sigma factor [Myxococcota bacterium]
MSDPVDRTSFDALVKPERPRLLAFAIRMVADRQDAEDVVQDALIKAYAAIDTFRGDAKLSTWLFAIVTRCCIDHLRSRRRWRDDAQHHTRADPETPHDQVLVELARPGARFEAREHIAFCFACVGRSLPAEEAAAVLLREVFGFSNLEAARMCDVSESVLRHRLSAGRGAMQDTFEGLCGLVAKTGVCHQCAGLRERAPSENRGEEVPDLAGDSAWSRRLRIVADADLADGATAQLHRLMFRAVHDAEERATRK